MLGKVIFFLYLGFNLTMKKIINIIIVAVIGFLVLYAISVILVCVVAVILTIANRIIAYRKKHRRFTDWTYKSNSLFKEEVGNQSRLKRIFYYERTDKVLNIIETKEEIMLTPIQGQSNSDFYKAEAAEWFKYKQHHQSLIEKEARQHYSTV